MKAWMLAAALVAPAAMGAEIKMGPAEVGQECQIRSSIFASAVQGHNGRAPRQETVKSIKDQLGGYLKSPQADKYIKATVDYVYSSVPVIDAFSVANEFTNLCIENPDQYIGGVSIVDWSAIKK